jgi:hypothetical protein
MERNDRERFLPAILKACEQIQPERQVLLEFTAFQQRRDRVRVAVNGYVAVVFINQMPILVARYAPPWAVKNQSTAVLDQQLLSRTGALANGKAGAFIDAIRMVLASSYVKVRKINRNVADALHRWLETREPVSEEGEAEADE